MSTFNTEAKYFDAFRQWANDRNLIQGSDNKAQFVKLVEELSEFDADPKDAIGDAFVVMTIMCAQKGFDIESVNCQPSQHADFYKEMMAGLGLLANAVARNRELSPAIGRIKDFLHYATYLNRFELIECLDQAWLDIKDRKGRMVDGVFVKEADEAA